MEQTSIGILIGLAFGLGLSFFLRGKAIIKHFITKSKSLETEAKDKLLTELENTL